MGELNQLAKALVRASEAIQRIGSQGITRLYAASRSNRDDLDFDVIAFSADILIMSRWAREAHAVSLLDDHGPPVPGRVIDLNLRSVVRTLARQYFFLLALAPTHTADPDTGGGVSLFNEFLKAAFADFKSTDYEVSWRQLDRAAAEAVALIKQGK